MLSQHVNTPALALSPLPRRQAGQETSRKKGMVVDYVVAFHNPLLFTILDAVPGLGP